MLPLLYHTHHSAYPEDLPFWLDLARQHAGPVLELGCGTGRVMLPLLQAGSPVVGLDHDRQMLAFLLGSAAGLAHPPAVFQADMAEFRLDRLFSLVIVPCNTLTSLEKRTRRGVFERIAAHLHPQGVFVASLPNPLLLADLPAKGPEEMEDEFVHPQTGDPIQVSSAWRRRKNTFDLTWHYDLLLPDGKIERYTLQTQHSLQPLEAYAAEMQSAGLFLQSVWGDFDRSPYQPDSPSLILLAGLFPR